MPTRSTGLSELQLRSTPGLPKTEHCAAVSPVQKIVHGHAIDIIAIRPTIGCEARGRSTANWGQMQDYPNTLIR